MQEKLINQSQIINKSKLPDDTKEFFYFVLAQMDCFDEIHKEKIAANTSLEKLKGWHEKGTIFYEMPIKNKLRNGIFRMWQTNGKLMCEIPFKDGAIDGPVILQKKIEETILFKNNIPLDKDI